MEHFEALGDGADAYLRGLEGAQLRNVAHHARQILALRERYASGDLLAALRHAQRDGAFDHAAVGRILETTAKPRTLDEYVADATRQKLEHWLGECRTEPRELHEYDELPCIQSLEGLAGGESLVERGALAVDCGEHRLHEAQTCAIRDGRDRRRASAPRGAARGLGFQSSRAWRILGCGLR